MGSNSYGESRILQWNGSTWNVLHSGTEQWLDDVWGVNANNVWVVGSSGLIWQWNGTTWSPQISNTLANLSGVWAADTKNAWAVGDHAVVKWNGTTWSPLANSTTSNLRGVGGADVYHVWVVGEYGTILRTSEPITRLLVSKIGDGSGAVRSTPPGIDCGGDCVEFYGATTATAITLTATPDQDSIFLRWTGACAGAAPVCQAQVAGNTVVTATFVRDRYPLTVTKAGNGSGAVVSMPAGIECGNDCAEVFRVRHGRHLDRCA